jgi:hypothetical protein
MYHTTCIYVSHVAIYMYIHTYTHIFPFTCINNKCAHEAEFLSNHPATKLLKWFPAYSWNINDNIVSTRRLLKYVSCDNRNQSTSWEGVHAGRIGLTKNPYEIVVRKPEAKNPLRRPTHRWKYNTEMHLKDVVLNPIAHSRSHRDWS